MTLTEQAIVIEVAAGMRECGHSVTNTIYESGALVYYTCTCRSYAYEFVAGHEVQRRMHQPREKI